MYACARVCVRVSVFVCACVCLCVCLCVCACYSATLLAFLVELLKSSVAMQEQMLGGKGFLVIGYLLEKVCVPAVMAVTLRLNTGALT